MDLDIDNYNLDDILRLFKMPRNFNEEHLKNAKRIVLRTHPDKSGLDSKYFLFYTKAYKMVYFVYNFKNKSANKTANVSNLVTEDSGIESHNLVLDKFFEKNKEMNKAENFNKWFNEQFEKHKIEEETNVNGYGDWLKSDNGVYEMKTGKGSIANMQSDFEKHKKQVRSMIVYNGIDDLYTSNLGGTLLGGIEGSDNYSSSLFSNLSYQDIKQAHTESVIPVSEEDFHNTKKFNNVEDYKKYRNTQDVSPLSEKESHNYISQKNHQDEIDSSRRAYYYAKQMEEANKNNQEFWGKLQNITNK
jgi:hypothetical protein